MTVAELIDRLLTFSPDDEVVLHDHEWGDNYLVTRVNRPARDFRADKSTKQVEIS
jgi:hypothetical protein